MAEASWLQAKPPTRWKVCASCPRADDLGDGARRIGTPARSACLRRGVSRGLHWSRFNFSMPQTLERRSQCEELRSVTPFGRDFRHVTVPYWYGQHVLRRLAQLETGIILKTFILRLHGPLVETLRGNTCRLVTKSVAFLPLWTHWRKVGLQRRMTWFESTWGVKERLHLEDLVSDGDTFL